MDLESKANEPHCELSIYISIYACYIEYGYQTQVVYFTLKQLLKTSGLTHLYKTRSIVNVLYYYNFVFKSWKLFIT